MPEYEYICDCGKSFSVFAPMAEASDIRVCECGQKAHRNWAAEHKLRDQKVKWPVEIEGLGVAPEQIPDALASDRKAGIDSDYNPETGAFIAKSERDLAKQAQRFGIRHRQGYF
jgi:hypothetical protein